VPLLLDRIDLMGPPAKPSAASVVAALSLAAASMAAAVYFGGHGQVPLAMTGTFLFVMLGGVGFELARRRS
jgi:hypothetical protein